MYAFTPAGVIREANDPDRTVEDWTLTAPTALVHDENDPLSNPSANTSPEATAMPGIANVRVARARASRGGNRFVIGILSSADGHPATRLRGRPKGYCFTDADSVPRKP